MIITYKIDYTYSNKYFIDVEVTEIETMLEFSKSINFQYFENKPTGLKSIKNSEFKNY